jgi:protein-tyrosine phosphatase
MGNRRNYPEEVFEEVGDEASDETFVGNHALRIRKILPIRNLYRSPRPGYPQHIVPRSILDTAKDVLTKNKITVVVCLLTDGESYKYYDTDLVCFYKDLGLTVCRYPVPDFGTPRVSFMLELSEEIRVHLKSKRRVLVHCSAGQGRTSLALNCFGMYRAKKGRAKEVDFGGAENSQQDNFLTMFRQQLRKQFGGKKNKVKGRK